MKQNNPPHSTSLAISVQGTNDNRLHNDDKVKSTVQTSHDSLLFDKNHPRGSDTASTKSLEAISASVDQPMTESIVDDADLDHCDSNPSQQPALESSTTDITGDSSSHPSRIGSQPLPMHSSKQSKGTTQRNYSGPSIEPHDNMSYSSNSANSVLTGDRSHVPHSAQKVNYDHGQSNTMHNHLSTAKPAVLQTQLPSLSPPFLHAASYWARHDLMTPAMKDHLEQSELNIPIGWYYGIFPYLITSKKKQTMISPVSFEHDGPLTGALLPALSRMSDLSAVYRDIIRQLLSSLVQFVFPSDLPDFTTVTAKEIQAYVEKHLSTSSSGTATSGDPAVQPRSPTALIVASTLPLAKAVAAHVELVCPPSTPVNVHTLLNDNQFILSGHTTPPLSPAVQDHLSASFLQETVSALVHIEQAISPSVYDQHVLIPQPIHVQDPALVDSPLLPPPHVNWKIPLLSHSKNAAPSHDSNNALQLGCEKDSTESKASHSDNKALDGMTVNSSSSQPAVRATKASKKASGKKAAGNTNKNTDPDHAPLVEHGHHTFLHILELLHFMIELLYTSMTLMVTMPDAIHYGLSQGSFVIQQTTFFAILLNDHQTPDGIPVRYTVEDLSEFRKSDSKFAATTFHTSLNARHGSYQHSYPYIVDHNGLMPKFVYGTNPLAIINNSARTFHLLRGMFLNYRVLPSSRRHLVVFYSPTLVTAPRAVLEANRLGLFFGNMPKFHYSHQVLYTSLFTADERATYQLIREVREQRKDALPAHAMNRTPEMIVFTSLGRLWNLMITTVTVPKIRCMVTDGFYPHPLLDSTLFLRIFKPPYDRGINDIAPIASSSQYHSSSVSSSSSSVTSSYSYAPSQQHQHQQQPASYAPPPPQYAQHQQPHSGVGYDDRGGKVYSQGYPSHQQHRRPSSHALQQSMSTYSQPQYNHNSTNGLNSAAGKHHHQYDRNQQRPAKKIMGKPDVNRHRNVSEHTSGAAHPPSSTRQYPPRQPFGEHEGATCSSTHTGSFSPLFTSIKTIALPTDLEEESKMNKFRGPTTTTTRLHNRFQKNPRGKFPQQKGDDEVNSHYNHHEQNTPRGIVKAEDGYDTQHYDSDSVQQASSMKRVGFDGNYQPSAYPNNHPSRHHYHPDGHHAEYLSMSPSVNPKYYRRNSRASGHHGIASPSHRTPYEYDSRDFHLDDDGNDIGNDDNFDEGDNDGSNYHYPAVPWTDRHHMHAMYRTHAPHAGARHLSDSPVLHSMYPHRQYHQHNRYGNQEAPYSTHHARNAAHGRPNRPSPYRQTDRSYTQSQSMSYSFEEESDYYADFAPDPRYGYHHHAPAPVPAPDDYGYAVRAYYGYSARQNTTTQPHQPQKQTKQSANVRPRVLSSKPKLVQTSAQVESDQKDSKE